MPPIDPDAELDRIRRTLDGDQLRTLPCACHHGVALSAMACPSFPSVFAMGASSSA